MALDPASGDTRVAGRAAHNACFTLVLPQEWTLTTDDEGAAILKDESSAATLKLDTRAVAAGGGLDDLATRDADFLRRDYEDLLGRPAQAITLSSVAAGAKRWSATWVDMNLPSASHSLTVETFIVPLTSASVLELTLTDVPGREAYEALMRGALGGLKVEAQCRA